MAGQGAPTSPNTCTEIAHCSAAQQKPQPLHGDPKRGFSGALSMSFSITNATLVADHNAVFAREHVLINPDFAGDTHHLVADLPETPIDPPLFDLGNCQQAAEQQRQKPRD
jgi:hypothetical protein